MMTSRAKSFLPHLALELVEGFKDDVSNGRSLDSIFQGLYQLPVPTPTFSLEIGMQKVLDHVWSQSSTMCSEGELEAFRDRAKRIKQERLKSLPEQQMDAIGTLLAIEISQFAVEWRESPVATTREWALTRLLEGNTHQFIREVWYIGLMKQRHCMPLEQINHYYNNATGLNDFLRNVPCFRAGFDASNRSECKMLEYIKEQVDPELDLIKIGMRSVDSNVVWYQIAKQVSLVEFIYRYAAGQGISSIKSISLACNCKRLFWSDLKRSPLGLGIKDGDALSISSKSLCSNKDRTPLDQLHEENKPIIHQFQGNKRRTNKSTRRKTSQPDPPKNDSKKNLHHWMDATARVLQEARSLFKGKRQYLDSMNLKRSPPKKKVPKSVSSVAPNDNPPIHGLAGKAGNTYFMIRVGEPENLYKTTKRHVMPNSPSSYRHSQGENTLTFDLHGFTREVALNKLDENLPGWVDIAMEDSCTFVIQVKIVCGGGSQMLAEVVKKWIQQNKYVANAPKTPRS